jgi:hypothetical protein
MSKQIKVDVVYGFKTQVQLSAQDIDDLSSCDVKPRPSGRGCKSHKPLGLL